MAGIRKAVLARWALQDAKNRLSEVVDPALRGNPQVVTRRGVDTAVIISHGEYTRITAPRPDRRPSLATYLLEGPTIDDGEAFERIAPKPRRKP